MIVLHKLVVIDIPYFLSAAVITNSNFWVRRLLEGVVYFKMSSEIKSGNVFLFSKTHNKRNITKDVPYSYSFLSFVVEEFVDRKQEKFT